MQDRQVAREISYSGSAATRRGRALIRLMENSSGRMRLIRRAKGYSEEIAEGRDFWAVIAARYGLRLEVTRGALSAIPREGPLVLVANHPYGLLDGLMLGRILSERRAGDFRVLAHSVFRRAPELERAVLPIRFDESNEATRDNLAVRAEALRYLGAGGAMGVFPGGTVSTAATPFAPPMDPGWRTFTARMIARSGATVVPVFFEGANSWLFQLASHVNYTLRMGLLIREFRRRADTPVRLAIGDPIPPEHLAPYRSDPKSCMAFLRRETYGLSSRPLAWDRLGFEFEERHRARGHGGGDLR